MKCHLLIKDKKIMDNISDKLSLWITEIIKGIVSNPDDVKVDASEDDMGLFFVVNVHEEDRGKVIGKAGAHAQALRILLRCAGGLNDVRASMKVEVPGSQFNPDREEETKENNQF